MLKSSGITLSLAVLAIVGALGIDAYLPSLQAIGQSLQADPATVQQTLSIYIAMMAFTTLFAGTLSDSFGRRPTVMASLLLFAGASVLAIFAKSISVLMLARGLQGIAAGFSVVLSRAIVQDRFQGPEAQRVMSLITMVFSIAPSVAPIIGGWLQASLGWQSVFVMLSLYGFGLWALWAWGVPETLPAERRVPFRMGRILGNYAQALGHGPFVLRILGIALAFIGVMLINSLIHLPPAVLDTITTLDNWLLAMAMAALGMTTHHSTLRQAGIKPLILGAIVLVWLVVAGGALQTWLAG